MKYYADMKKNGKDFYLLTRKGSIAVAEESKLENNMSSMISLCNPSPPPKIYLYVLCIYVYTYSCSSNNTISLLYNVDVKKKKSTPAWGQCMHGICIFSCLCFLRVLWFLPTSRRYAQKVNGHVSIVPV